MLRPLRTGVALALAAAGAAWAYGGVLVGVVRDWAADGDYSHGFLIAPLAIYIGWQRRGELARAPVRPHRAGLLMVAFAVLLLGMGTLGAELFLTRLSLLAAVAGSVLYIWGGAHLKRLVFPLLLLSLVIPLPRIVLNQITFPLQLVSSGVGVTMLEYLDVPVLREGNIIVLSHTTLEVAEACSGIRSLTSLVALAAVYGFAVHATVVARVLLAVTAVPIAVLANSARIAGTGFAAHHYGPAAAQGFFHGFSGWVVFLVGTTLLVGVHWLGRAATSRARRADAEVAARARRAVRPPDVAAQERQGS